MRKHIIQTLIICTFILLGSEHAYGQLFKKARLQITVLDGLGNIVEGAEVTLYASSEDYQSNNNPVKSAVSDEKGKVKFKKLDPVVYYVDVRKDDLSNDGRGVQLEKLVTIKKTKANIVIE